MKNLIMTIIAILFVSVTALARGMACHITDRSGKTVHRTVGLAGNLSRGQIQFGQVDGFELTATAYTSPRSPLDISIVVQVTGPTIRLIDGLKFTGLNKVDVEIGIPQVPGNGRKVFLRCEAG